MPDQFNKEQLKEFQEVFDLFDRDNDGTIDVKEFLGIMRALGQTYTNEEIENIFIEADTRQVGVLNYGTFITAMETYFQDDETVEGLRQAFRAFDRNKVGSIDAEELKYYLTNYGNAFTNKECTDFFHAADINQDGIINYELFVTRLANFEAPRNPEDGSMFNAKVYLNENVERNRRAHQNDLENIPFFIVISLIYLFTNPSIEPTKWIIRVYVLSRIVYTILYTVSKSILRIPFYEIGLFTNVYLSGSVIYYFFPKL